MGISTSSSASLFYGSLDEQITQTTNLTTPPALPTTTAVLLQEQTEQLTSQQTNGNHHYTDSPKNITQNNISSNASQNTTTDDQEATFTGNDTIETQTIDSGFEHENTTTSGLNKSQSMPGNTADFYNETTSRYIINNSTMENETLANVVKAPVDSGNLPSQSFQNTTFQDTSQMPEVANSSSSQSSLNMTISNITNDIINETTKETEFLLGNGTRDFPVTTQDISPAPANETVFQESSPSENSITSNFTGEKNSTTQTVPSQNQTVSASDVSETSTLLIRTETGTTNVSPNIDNLTVETNGSQSIDEQLTTEPSWIDPTSGGTTAGGGVDPGNGSVIADGQGMAKSDAVAVAIGVIVGLLLVATLIIAFMLIRRRIVHG